METSRLKVIASTSLSKPTKYGQNTSLNRGGGEGGGLCALVCVYGVMG